MIEELKKFLREQSKLAGEFAQDQLNSLHEPIEVRKRRAQWHFGAQHMADGILTWIADHQWSEERQQRDVEAYLASHKRE